MNHKEVTRTRICLSQADSIPEYLEFCVLVHNFGKRETLPQCISKHTRSLKFAIRDANNVKSVLKFGVDEISIFGFNGYFWEEIELTTEECTRVYPMFSKAS